MFIFVFLLLFLPTNGLDSVYFKYPYGIIPVEESSEEYKVIYDMNDLYDNFELTDITQTLSSFQELLYALNPVNLLQSSTFSEVPEYFKFPQVDGVVFDNSTGTLVFHHAYIKKSWYSDKHDKVWTYNSNLVYYERYDSSIFVTNFYNSSYDTNVVGPKFYPNTYCFLYSPPVPLEQACTEIPRCIGYIKSLDCLASIAKETTEDTTFHGTLLSYKRTKRSRGIISNSPAVVVVIVITGLLIPYLGKLTVPFF